MGLIKMNGLRFFAYHGVYPEEQLTGNHFEIDIVIEADLETAAMTDDLDNAINYETVYLICQARMRKPVKLIETVAYHILHDLKKQFAIIETVKIEIRKLNPIPGERMAASAVEIDDEFVSSCPRSNTPFICYGDDTCWCQENQVYSATQENLKRRFRGCLCQSCLEFFAK